MAASNERVRRGSVQSAANPRRSYSDATIDRAAAEPAPIRGSPSVRSASIR